MNDKWLLRKISGCAVVMLTLMACGAPALTPTPTSVPKPKVGQWTGDKVSFVVSEAGTVAEFTITVSDCQVSVNKEIVIEPNAAFGSFTINPEGVFEGEDVESATDFMAVAEFESEISLSGSYTVQLCGGWMLLNSQDVAWTAEWQAP